MRWVLFTTLAIGCSATPRQPAPAPKQPIDVFAGLCPVDGGKQASQEALELRRDAVCSVGSDEARAACRAEWSSGEPTCTNEPIGIPELRAPWQDLAIHCRTTDGSESCDVAIAVADQLVRGPELTTAGTGLPSTGDEPPGIDHPIVVDTRELRDVIPGDPLELVVRYHGAIRGVVIVCRAAPTAACSAPIDVAGAGWSALARVERGHVVVEPDPASDAPPANMLGGKPIEFR